MALTDSQWAQAAADIFARLAAGDITQSEAATELAAATEDWPTRSLSNAGVAEKLSSLLLRANAFHLTAGPPPSEIGGIGSVAIDATNKVFYGPKLTMGEWPEGVAFLAGPAGPAIELQTSSTHIQWRVVGAESWTNLITRAALKGADGQEVSLRTDAGKIQWRLGDGEWQDLISLSDLKGEDGREVEFNAGVTHLQWRYVGAAEWTDLFSWASVTPEAVPGPAAWTAVVAKVADGERRVEQIVDWFGGGGTKPDTGMFIGPEGWVETAAEATDVRGAGGSGSGDMMAANNLSDLTDKAAARLTLQVYSKTETDTALGAKADLVGGKVSISQLPALAITDVFEVANQTAMLALTAERGDVAIRTDENKSYVLAAEPATTLANWKLLRTPTDVVLSVAGLTGAVTAAALKTALAYAITDIPGLQTALDARLSLAGGVMTGGLKLKALTETRGTVETGALDVSAGTFFEPSWPSNTTVSLANLPASPTVGDTVTATIKATITGSPVLTWPTGTKWIGGTAPTVAAGTLFVTLVATWSGSAWAYIASGGMAS